MSAHHPSTTTPPKPHRPPAHRRRPSSATAAAAILVASSAAALLLSSGCARQNAASSEIATVNIARITNNWPKFINYNNQLASDSAAIDRSNAPQAQKAKELADLQARFAQMQNEVTGDVRAAAEQVAKEKNYKLVVTREFVGYGGVDITADVEKILKIEEKATPSP